MAYYEDPVDDFIIPDERPRHKVYAAARRSPSPMARSGERRGGSPATAGLPARAVSSAERRPAWRPTGSTKTIGANRSKPPSRRTSNASPKRVSGDVGSLHVVSNTLELDSTTKTAHYHAQSFAETTPLRRSSPRAQARRQRMVDLAESPPFRCGAPHDSPNTPSHWRMPLPGSADSSLCSSRERTPSPGFQKLFDRMWNEGHGQQGATHHLGAWDNGRGSRREAPSPRRHTIAFSSPRAGAATAAREQEPTGGRRRWTAGEIPPGPRWTECRCRKLLHVVQQQLVRRPLARSLKLRKLYLSGCLMSAGCRPSIRQVPTLCPSREPWHRGAESWAFAPKRAGAGNKGRCRGGQQPHTAQVVPMPVQPH